MFAKYAPAPFLSVVIDDCISKGKDYYNGGPRYNTNYIQCTGLATVTDSLSVLKNMYSKKSVSQWTAFLMQLQPILKEKKC